MKKLLFILPVFFFSLAVNAQQTEDDIYVGKGKTFGNYKGADTRNTKPVKGQLNITGTVVKVDWCEGDCLTMWVRKITGTVVRADWCEEDCLTMWVKKDDGTIVSVGTKDYGFTIPKETVGKRIIIEGIDPAKLISEKKTVKQEYQKDIRFAATGIKIFN